MENLKTLKCEVCSAGAPELTGDQIQLFKQQIPQWELVEENQVKKLIRKFKFRDFKDTLAFVNKVGILAEKEGHHPVMLIEYNRLNIWWWTHKIKGLHNNDFIMAAKTDGIL
ncbi:MAG: 4a-hydroxytetrahydrobiopterin dehydratase [Candidatus Omnitrophota bacterium]